MLGEYAVVDGAPAIVVAVNRGIECLATLGGSQLRVSSSTDSRFVSTALCGVQAPHGHYLFRAFNRCNTPEKAGIGLSAAATVVATLAGSAMQGEANQAMVYAKAIEAHRAVQGSGSGVDIAASTFGGVLRFQRGQPSQALPRSLVDQLVIVWAQKPALTGPRVEAYLSWHPRDSFVTESAQLSEGFASDPLKTLDASRTLLESMAVEAGIAYRTAELDHIARLAETYGGVAKPSGAGGGDCAVALFTNQADKHAFSDACQRHGLIVIPTEVADGACEVEGESA